MSSRVSITLPVSGDAISGLSAPDAVTALQELVSRMSVAARRSQRNRARKAAPKRVPCPDRGGDLYMAGFPQESEDTPFAALPAERREHLAAAAVLVPRSGYALWARSLGRSGPRDAIPEDATPWKDLEEADRARWNDLAKAQRDEFEVPPEDAEAPEDVPVTVVVDREVFAGFLKVVADMSVCSHPVKSR